MGDLRGRVGMDVREDTVLEPDAAPPIIPRRGVGPAPRDWSLWLLPVVSLMLLAGAVAIYYLPTSFDLLAPICYGLSLATVLLCVVAVRTIPVLASPLNDAIRHRSDGSRINWNRFASLSSLLLASILVAGLATGGMLLFVLEKPRIYIANGQFEQPFVLAITAAIVVVLLLFVWLVRIEPLQKLMQLRFAGAGVLAIPLATYLALNASPPSLFDDVYYGRSTYAGPIASWPEMVQFATHEAERIDKDAILYDISSYLSDAPYSPKTSLFSMDLRFVRPTGEDIWIAALDTDPIRLQSVTQYESSLIVSYKYAREHYADWFAYIKLGPRDVYSLTEKEAIEFAQRNNIDVAKFWPGVDMSLTSFNIWEADYGIQAAWDIYYISRGGVDSLDIVVDAKTGEVLARRPYVYDGTATPAPQSSATVTPSP